MDKYLVNISDIDNSLENINKEKNKFINSHSFKFNIVNFLNKFRKSILYILLIVIVAILSYIILPKPTMSIIFTVGFIIKINISILFIVKRWSPNDKYYNKVEDYDNEINYLLQERSKQVIFYKYFKDKYNFLLSNIKSRMNNDEYIDYQEYIKNNNTLSSNDLKIIMNMKTEEDILLNNIKNELNYQINYEENDSEKKEYLKQVQMILS